MLVDEERGGEGDGDCKQGRELTGLMPGVGECCEGDGVECAGDPDGAFPSELCGDGVEVCGLVVVEVLEGVDDVETRDPEEDHDRDGVDLWGGLDV